jgi:hypothetical protein
MPRPSSRRRIRIASQRFGANNPYTIVRVRRTSVDRQSYTPLPPLYPPFCRRGVPWLPADACRCPSLTTVRLRLFSVLGHSAPRMLTAALAAVWHENSISRTGSCALRLIETLRKRTVSAEGVHDDGRLRIGGIEGSLSAPRCPAQTYGLPGVRRGTPDADRGPGRRRFTRCQIG